VRDQVSHPYKTTGKIIHDLFMNSYLLIFLYIKETEANCNPIYALSTIVTKNT
jgi:hypothetical protein